MATLGQGEVFEEPVKVSHQLVRSLAAYVKILPQIFIVEEDIHRLVPVVACLVEQEGKVVLRPLLGVFFVFLN